MLSQATRWNGPHVSRRQPPQLKTCAGLIAVVLLTWAASAQAQTLTDSTLTTTCEVDMVQTRLIEWDLNQMEDLIPGSLVVDDRSSSRHSKVWFATRNGETRVYRFTPGRAMKKDKAQAISWPLGAIATGGLRLRHSNDGRFVFVNTNDDDGVNGALVAVDTREDRRITWLDRPQQEHMSDVSVDTRGSGHSVFTAARVYTDPNTGLLDGENGVVQRLRPQQPEFRKDGYGNTTVVVPADVTRWLVGGGAGSCQDSGPGSPCIPGMVVDHRHGHPIYFSAPEFIFPATGTKPETRGAIGELDPRPVKCDAYDMYDSCARVRFWPLPNVDQHGRPVSQPRHLFVDDHGKVWGVTPGDGIDSNGHLFSLEVDRNYDRGILSLHNPFGNATLANDDFSAEDLFAVAPDGGIVGFTDSEHNEVSVLFPDRVEFNVKPEPRKVRRVERKLEGIQEEAVGEPHAVDPREAEAMGTKYTRPNDGTYVETDVSTGFTMDGSMPSMIPTGMAPDGARRTGSFFYGVSLSSNMGMETNRIGHFEIKIDPDKDLERRRDDDDYDDDGDDDEYDADDDGDGVPDMDDDDDDNDCIPDHMDKDKDNDGVEDEYDSQSHRETKRTDRGSMGAGQSKAYEMESDPNTVLMLAVIEAADAMTPLSIDILDPTGVVVLSTPPALGKAVATATPVLSGVYTIRVKNAGTAETTYKTTLIGRQIWF